MRTINDCRDWRDKCFTLISVNKPEDKVSTRYKCFCEGCEWKSHEEVSSLYRTYHLEDGNIISIDRHHTSQKMRQYLNYHKL